jgi:hypothetical protein
MEQHWGGRIDETRVRELVTADLGLRGSTEAPSEEGRFSLLDGATMALLGEEYPGFTDVGVQCPGDLNAGFNAFLAEDRRA